MNTYPYWNEIEPVANPLPTKDLEVDGSLIGGGITRVSAALVEWFGLRDGDTL